MAPVSPFRRFVVFNRALAVIEYDVVSLGVCGVSSGDRVRRETLCI